MPNVMFVVPSTPVLLPLWGLWMVASWLRLRHRAVLTPLRLVTAWVMGCYLVIVLAVTLLPLQLAFGAYANHASTLSKANVIPLVTIDPRTFVLNLVMTVPLGIVLPLVRPVRGLVHLMGLALGVSASVEMVQFLTNVLLSSGRLADVNDLVGNTLGASAGFLTLRCLCRIAVVARATERLRIPPVADPVFAKGDPVESAAPLAASPGDGQVV
jgi:glycopeptide antibiotics resistance protein